jgi:thiol-disulfide isomerase/thioredoxin
MTMSSPLTQSMLAVLVLGAGTTLAAPAHAQMQEQMQMQMKGLQVGDMAPTAMVQTLDGAPVDLSRFVGKTPVLIEFWATWCPLCRELEPTIKAIHDEHKGKLDIVRIVVPQNQTPEKAREYVASRGLPGHFFFDADGAADKAFAAYHTSYSVVLDRHGRVVHSADGTKQDLARAVRKAIAN